MKVATLTLPLHPNYGATLQAYALQTVIKGLGHDCKLIDVDRSGLRSMSRKIAYNIRRYIKGNSENNIQGYGNEKFKHFIVNELSRTKKVSKNRDFMRRDIQDFDAYIVGSDQIWRPNYAINVSRYFLDFTKKDVRKISYAASFGTDNWEFSNSLTRECYNLVQKFDYLSVRELGGKKNCLDYFNIKPEIVLDPTFLVGSDIYDRLIDKYSETETFNGIFCYILDQSEQKITKIKGYSNDCVFVNYNVSDEQKVGIGDWLKGIRDTDLFITDSFHGVAFAIIFNKQFIAIGNEKRGLSRFKSVLKIFGLEDRLISDSELSSNRINDIFSSRINYEKVNSIKLELINNSMKFLKRSLI